MNCLSGGMVYTHALRACGASHAGSSPASGTKYLRVSYQKYMSSFEILSNTIPENVKEAVTLMISGEPKILFLMSGGIASIGSGEIRPSA